PRPRPGARRQHRARQRRPRRGLRGPGARHAGRRPGGDDLPRLAPRHSSRRRVQRGAVRARQQSRRPDARLRLGGAHRDRRLRLDRRTAYSVQLAALPGTRTPDVGRDRASCVSARADALALFRAHAPRHLVLPVPRAAGGAHRPAGFRADAGFVPQVGVRQVNAWADAILYRSGAIFWVSPWVKWQRVTDRTTGDVVSSYRAAAIQLSGVHDLYVQLRLVDERLRALDALLGRRYGWLYLEAAPGRRLARVTLLVRLGGDVDVANARP